MKICISSTGKSLDAAVDPRFGRCGVFVFVDTDDMSFSAAENTAAFSGGGAGTKAAQTVSSMGAKAVVTGNIGPNAFTALNAAGIPVYTGASGTVRDATEQFKSGSLRQVQGPTAEAHSGGGMCR